jgi:VWFA-related protein
MSSVALGQQATVHGQSPAAQQVPAAAPDADAYKLKVTSQNVVLDVVVNDKNRKNVKGLSKDDFEVFEDKKLQTITSFVEVEGPKPETPRVKVDSTAELDRLEPEAPVSILVIDELTTKFADLAFARYSLSKYLKGQGDTLDQPTMLMVVNFKRIAVLRDYTTSRKEILDAMEHHLADYSSLYRVGNKDWQTQQVNAAFGSMMGVAEATAGHRGHKNLIWVGRGFPPVDEQMMTGGAREEFMDGLAKCTQMLRDSRVTLYALDPQGVNPLPPDRDDMNLEQDNPIGGQWDFDAIAVATGGKALYGRNDVDKMIDESVRDGENFYTLSYRPTDKSDDPQAFRKIRVVMKNPELKATARKGYYASSPPVAPVTDAKGRLTNQLKFDVGVATGSMLVYDGVGITVTRDAASPDNFLLHMKAGDLPLEIDATQKASADITVMAVAYDRKNKVLDHNARVLTVRMKTQPPADGPDERPVMVPVTISTKAPVARIRFVVRANGNGKLGAENFFLVDPKTLPDPASGVSRDRKY